MRRDRNAVALESVSMSMLRVNMVEQLAKKYPILEAEIKKFQTRRVAALAKKAEDTTGIAERTAVKMHEEAEVHSVQPARGQATDISSWLSEPSAGGPAQEVRNKARKCQRQTQMSGQACT